MVIKFGSDVVPGLEPELTLPQTQDGTDTQTGLTQKGPETSEQTSKKIRQKMKIGQKKS